LKRSRLSVVSLRANGATVPKLDHHDFLSTIYQIIIYLPPYRLILAKNTKNKELKLG
jgi:hypothetical protein